MKYILHLFVFLLPFHAVVITFLQCKMGVDTNILRFWKELVVLFLLSIVSFQLLYKYKTNIWSIFKNNTLLWVIIAFILCSLFYVFFPYIEIKTQALLWFKYDVFFLFTLLIWMYLASARENIIPLTKTLFASTLLVILLFLPWYLSWDIAKKAELLWYSTAVSTYEAGGCLAYAQNVKGGHNRFQASFGDPIRFSVFLVIVFILLTWYILEFKKEKGRKYQITLFFCFALLFWISIFYAFTKTSILWWVVGAVLFLYLVRKVIFNKTFSRRFMIILGGIISIILAIGLYIKRDLFLHPEAVLWRAENLIISVKMFLFNPLWYGLWIAWPASQLATSNDTSLSKWVYKFLPENWYVQIFLEQGLIWGLLFLSLVILIALALYKIMMQKKDYFSISLFTAFISLLFMANFTHVFEESATNFILFLLIWAYIAKETKGWKK